MSSRCSCTVLSRGSGSSTYIIQAFEKDQVGGATHGEAWGGEDLPEEHDHPTRWYAAWWAYTFNQMEIKQSWHATTCVSSPIPICLLSTAGLVLVPPTPASSSSGWGKYSCLVPGGEKKERLAYRWWFIQIVQQWLIPNGKARNPRSYSVYETRCHSSSNLVLEYRIPREWLVFSLCRNPEECILIPMKEWV